MQILERLRGRARFERESIYQSCPNTMSNNAGNEISSNQNQSAEEEINNRTLASEVNGESEILRLEIPNLPESERSIICCCCTSQGALRLLLFSYWLWSLAAFVYNVDTVFPALYLFPICSMLLAFIGSTIGIYQLLIPFMIMTAWDMVTLFL